MNSGDQAGTVMAALVWLLMIYSMITVSLLEATQGIPGYVGMLYCLLCTMALASHAKCSLTDPGSVPRAAVPCESQRQTQSSHSMCGECQTFKPPHSHHCRICNRCVSRMDHHCPWMNNCVGAGNLSMYKSKLYHSTWTQLELYELCIYYTMSLLYILTHSLTHYYYTNLVSLSLIQQNTFSYFWYTHGPVPPLHWYYLVGTISCATMMNVPFIPSSYTLYESWRFYV